MKVYKKLLLETTNWTKDEEEELDIWMTGECIPFAVALSEAFPEYRTAILLSQYELDEDEDSEYDFDFVHAFCYHPSNHKIIIDAKGVRALSDLYDDFYDIDPRIDWDIPNSKFLIDNYSGVQFYSEESYDWSDEFYNDAKDWITKHKSKYQVIQ